MLPPLRDRSMGNGEENVCKRVVGLGLYASRISAKSGVRISARRLGRRISERGRPYGGENLLNRVW